jgi:23S rRNA maturation-related 3'-5' exoribonuclease YhaM
MSHIAMLVIFYENVISCQSFNLLHIYRKFVEKTHFLNEFFKINEMVSKHHSYYVKCHGSIYFQGTFTI